MQCPFGINWLCVLHDYCAVGLHLYSFDFAENFANFLDHVCRVLLWEVFYGDEAVGVRWEWSGVFGGIEHAFAGGESLLDYG